MLPRGAFLHGQNPKFAARKLVFAPTYRYPLSTKPVSRVVELEGWVADRALSTLACPLLGRKRTRYAQVELFASWSRPKGRVAIGPDRRHSRRWAPSPAPQVTVNRYKQTGRDAHES
jgi:hypothetical protein